MKRLPFLHFLALPALCAGASAQTLGGRSLALRSGEMPEDHADKRAAVLFVDDVRRIGVKPTSTLRQQT